MHKYLLTWQNHSNMEGPNPQKNSWKEEEDQNTHEEAIQDKTDWKSFTRIKGNYHYGSLHTNFSGEANNHYHQT